MAGHAGTGRPTTASPPVPPLALAVFALVLGVAASAPRATAQDSLKIYRCVDASGAVTLQNDVPCPKGTQQTVRQIGALPTMPAPVAVPAPVRAPAPAAAPAASPVAVAVPAAPAAARSAPPPLFQCRTWDDRDYLGDTAEPPEQCVPLQTVGIDGSASLAAGSACEMRRDLCTPIAAEQVCTSWKKRVDEAEFRWKVGGARDDERKRAFERLAGVYRGSTCVGD